MNGTVKCPKCGRTWERDSEQHVCIERKDACIACLLFELDGTEFDAIAAEAQRRQAATAVAPEDRAEQFLAAAIARSPKPLQELGEYLTRVLDEDHWPTAERFLLQLATSPAPVAPEAGEAERIAARLGVLALAVPGHQNENSHEWTMRVPAEPERDADLVLSRAAQLLGQQDYDATLLRGLIELAGHLQDGSDTTVRIYADDATRDWFVEVGPGRRYFAKSLRQALAAAITAGEQAHG